MATEEFSAGSKYQEVTTKCFCCGRLIPTEGIEETTDGEVRLYCSADCIDVYERYRRPHGPTAGHG